MGLEGGAMLKDWDVMTCDMRFAAQVYLLPDMHLYQQDPAAVNACLEEVCNKHPIFRAYENLWPVREYIADYAAHCICCGRVAKHKNQQGVCPHGNDDDGAPKGDSSTGGVGQIVASAAEHQERIEDLPIQSQLKVDGDTADQSNATGMGRLVHNRSAAHEVVPQEVDADLLVEDAPVVKQEEAAEPLLLLHGYNSDVINLVSDSDEEPDPPTVLRAKSSQAPSKAVSSKAVRRTPLAERVSRTNMPTTSRQRSVRRSARLNHARPYIGKPRKVSTFEGNHKDEPGRASSTPADAIGAFLTSIGLPLNIQPVLHDLGIRGKDQLDGLCSWENEDRDSWIDEELLILGPGVTAAISPYQIKVLKMAFRKRGEYLNIDADADS
ncbi:hypothetical protein PUNSTDRAFT_141049 [Punctularia strigosozonata HHB-11173 SS5]|uniref:uncharacterized protein n=1 Tax=Punctularia strigosozonata (strain HHB-11173) TaxID=741275 RepID=UPI00044185C8|nr:uncharacterized protein PUNSTDRAFT_141049 [Punctularia strigosozonata HHB-11173 SS5]EIN12295.1 hypothetical protein PUNSTDRAFT_141049 [Punctularia strigosozonata HHB-11173 SS5]